MRPGFFRPPDVVLFGPAARALFENVSFRPPGILPPAGNFLLAQKVPQKRLPPVALRGLRLTRNPLGASLSCTHQRGSRSAVQNLERVSSSFCGQPRVFDNISFCPSGGVSLTENVFMGHAARAFFCPLGLLVPPRAGHFFWVPKKSNQKKPLWPRAFASLATLLGLPSSAPISESRGTL